MSTIYKLIIEDDEGKTTVYPLSQGEISIGRKEGNTIRLMERNVSRRHARLLRNNGSVFIEDLDSYNGIRINGERINGRYEVKEGDLVEIGDYHLALQAAEIEEDARDRSRGEGPPTIEDRKDKDEWPLAGTVPDFRLPEEILAGVRGAVAPQKPTVTAATRDTLVDTPMPPQAPMPSVGAPKAQAQGRDPLIGPPPRAEQQDAQRSLPPFPLPGGLPPPSVPFLPNRNDSKGSTPASKRDNEPLPPTVPVHVGPARVSTVPRLVCVSTSYAGKEFALTRPELIIGRVEDNDVVIEHRSVSRNHAKIVFDGRVHKIIDLQSANGILVNGEEYAMTDLRKNDLIELGHVRFRFIPAGESFAPNEEELKEMREAGVSAPSQHDSSPPSPAKEASSPPPSRVQPLAAVPMAAPVKHDAHEVGPGFDPSTAATVTDTPLSALTVGGLLTPEVSVSSPPTPAQLPTNEPTGPRHIKEKRPTEQNSDRNARTDTAVPRSQAHDQRPTEINVAARSNGHAAAVDADSDAPSRSALGVTDTPQKRASKARAATEPAPKVEVEGRLDPPKKGTKVAILLVFALGFLMVVGVAIVILWDRPNPYLQTLEEHMKNKAWDAAVNLCNAQPEIKTDTAALLKCNEALMKQNEQLQKRHQGGGIQDETAANAKDPNETEEQAAVEEEKQPVEEEKKPPVQQTKKAPPPQKEKPAKAGAKEQRAKARELFQKGTAALQNGELSTAEDLLKECLKLGDLPECYRNLGVVYAQLSDTEKSIKNYRKYVELKPNAPDADYIRGIIEGSQP